MNITRAYVVGIIDLAEHRNRRRAEDELTGDMPADDRPWLSTPFQPTPEILAAASHVEHRNKFGWRAMQ